MGEIKGVWKKLAMARMKVQETNLVMTGTNTYDNYRYFELADFMPAINKVNFEIGLVSLFNLTNDNETAVLEIIDVEDGSSVTFKTKSAECIMVRKGARMNPIQELGATYTYMRRYMYMGAYEIAESDIVDSIENEPLNNPRKQNGNGKKEEPKLATQNQLSKIFSVANEMNIVKTDLECSIFKDYNIKSMSELTTTQASDIITNIKKICQNIIERKEEALKAISALEMNEELINIMERENIKALPKISLTKCKKVYKELKDLKENKENKEEKPEIKAEETKKQEENKQNTGKGELK
ncbi:hypothetical protein FV113G1_13030 [Fusobacterium varium]|nr:hypothetical protein FV113G1_13030 [Fusobacterium varium]